MGVFVRLKASVGGEGPRGRTFAASAGVRRGATRSPFDPAWSPARAMTVTSVSVARAVRGRPRAVVRFPYLHMSKIAYRDKNKCVSRLRIDLTA